MLKCLIIIDKILNFYIKISRYLIVKHNISVEIIYIQVFKYFYGRYYKLIKNVFLSKNTNCRILLWVDSIFYYYQMTKNLF